MADRTSAGLFASIFDALASGEALDPETVWDMTFNYDFHPCQMGCDESLEALGLLRRCENEDCPDYDEDYDGAHVYGPEGTECDSCGETPEI